MRCRSLLFLAVAWAGLSSLAQGADAPTLQDQYLAIYIKMTTAASLEAGGNLRDALAGFEDCYTRLEKIHVDNPDWEHALVTSRMGDCKARILELEAKLAPPTKTSTTPVASAPATAAESPKARLLELEQAAKAAPGDPSAQFNLGAAYYQLGQTDEAIATLQHGLTIEPGNIYGHNYLGCAFMRKNRIESAAKEFNRAIALMETFPEPHYNLAILYATEDPPVLSAARTQYRRALELGLVPDPHLEKVLHVSEP